MRVGNGGERGNRGARELHRPRELLAGVRPAAGLAAAAAALEFPQGRFEWHGGHRLSSPAGSGCAVGRCRDRAYGAGYRRFGALRPLRDREAPELGGR